MANKIDINPIMTMGKITDSKDLYPTHVKVTPTASASILVAIDKVRINISLFVFVNFEDSSFPFSVIIFMPIYANRANAIQWSIDSIKLPTSIEVSHPIIGIKA